MVHDLADKAQAAGDNNDEFTFWQVCKTLGFRETRKFHQVVKRTVADPEEDREAWKDFLSSIQKDEGEVSSSVWDLIPVVPQPHTDLANPPTWKEYQIALHKMACRKTRWNRRRNSGTYSLRWGTSPIYCI